MFHAAAAAKWVQLCLTLCDPTDGSPPGSAILGILQTRTLEWVAISFSNVWKWKVKVKLLSRILLLLTPWTSLPGSSLHGIFPGKSTGVGYHCLLQLGFIVPIKLAVQQRRKKRKKRKINLQNKSKHNNNKCFSWVTAVSVLSLAGSHSPPHLPRMPSPICISCRGSSDSNLVLLLCVLASNVHSYQN